MRHLSRLCCVQQIRLKRRLCSDAYLASWPLVWVGRVPLDGSRGRSSDYPVKMRRLPEERVLERLLGENAAGS